MNRLTFSEYASRLREFIRAQMTADGPPSLADQGFNDLALALFELQSTFNLPYRKFCGARGVSSPKMSHWTEIPAIPASAFKELELTCLAPAERTAVFHSSGTTEHKPSKHFHSNESLTVYEASLLPWFQAHFVGVLGQASCLPSGRLTRGEQFAGETPRGTGGTPVLLTIAGELRMVSLTPPPHLAPHSSLAYMFHTVQREFGGEGSGFTGEVEADGSWMLNTERTAAVLAEAVEARRPVALLGTAFNFVHLLDHLIERGVRFQLSPGSRALETGGYKGRSRVLEKSELHALVTERLGIPREMILCEYGMSELSSQAYERKVQRPTSNVQRLTFNVQRLTFNVQRLTFNVQRSTSNVQRPGRVFVFPPWARARIISPETGREVGEGETGLIRVYDLANVWSVMAIQTEDLGIRRGNGFELLGRAPLAERRGCSLMTV